MNIDILEIAKELIRIKNLEDYKVLFYDGCKFHVLYPSEKNEKIVGDSGNEYVQELKEIIRDPIINIKFEYIENINNTIILTGFNFKSKVVAFRFPE